MIKKSVIVFIFLSLFSFHKSFPKKNLGQPECTIDSLQDAKLREALKRVNDENGNAIKYGEDNNHTFNLCLDGNYYILCGCLGFGSEGIVYKIKNKKGEEFALKIYFYAHHQNGDQLILNKANKSRKYLNIPMVVNKKYQYSIFPVLLTTFYYGKESHWPQNASIRFSRFIKKVTKALAKDGLKIDDHNEGNYMFAECGHLKRIDFSSVRIK